MPPLAMIPGWHTYNIFEDALHDDHIGLRLDASGSILKELCAEGFWGDPPSSGTWQHKLDVPLGRAHRSFKSWCKIKKTQVSQPLFSRLQLSMTVRTDFPVLKAKARNSVYVSEWLLQCCTESRSHSDSEHKRQRQLLMHGFMTFYNVIHDARPRIVLSAAEIQSLKEAREMICFCYHWLAHM